MYKFSFLSPQRIKIKVTQKSQTNVPDQLVEKEICKYLINNVLYVQCACF